MNCRRIEKLIPLFVEGDLEQANMQMVASHLDGCALCAQLANEYGDSQAWLQSYAPPEFDKAFFTDLKQSVMQEIEQKQSRPSLLQKWSERWNQNLALAMAIAVLIVAGAIVLTIDSGKTKIDTPDNTLANGIKQQPEEPKQKDNQHQQNHPENLPEKKYRFVKHQPRRFQSKSVPQLDEKLPVAMQQSGEPLDIFAVNIFENTLSANPINIGGIASLPILSDSTRIEFQTSDPNIRIIWFAPKPTISESKIDTE
jgi:hypothetical protein